MLKASLNSSKGQFSAKLGKTFPVGWVGGWLAGWLRKAGNKAKLSPASAGAWAELGNKTKVESVQLG